MTLGSFSPSGRSRPFDAAYPGECAECGGYFDEGDEVMYEDDEVIHFECRSDA